MIRATSLYDLTAAAGAASLDGYAGATVADAMCGSPASPVLMTVDHLFKHLRASIMADRAPHPDGTVTPASVDDGGRGPALAGPR